MTARRLQSPYARTSAAYPCPRGLCVMRVALALLMIFAMSCGGQSRRGLRGNDGPAPLPRNLGEQEVAHLEAWSREDDAAALLYGIALQERGYPRAGARVLDALLRASDDPSLLEAAAGRLAAYYEDVPSAPPARAGAPLWPLLRRVIHGTGPLPQHLGCPDAFTLTRLETTLPYFHYLDLLPVDAGNDRSAVSTQETTRTWDSGGASALSTLPRSITARRCELTLTQPENAKATDRAPGVALSTGRGVYAEVEAEVPARAFAQTLVVESMAHIQVTLVEHDGKETVLLAQRDLETLRPGWAAVLVPASSKPRTLRLRVATGQRSARVLLAWLPDTQLPATGWRQDQAALTTFMDREATGRLVAALVAHGRLQSPDALQLLADADDVFSLWVKAQAAASDPLRSEDVRTRAVKAHYTTLRERAPKWWRPQLALASSAILGGQVAEGERVLDALRREYPKLSVLAARQAALLLKRGSDAEAARLLAPLAATRPEACEVHGLWFQATHRGPAAERARAEKALLRCRPELPGLVDSALSEVRLDDAAHALDTWRAELGTPLPDDYHVRALRLALLEGAGQPDAPDAAASRLDAAIKGLDSPFWQAHLAPAGEVRAHLAPLASSRSAPDDATLRLADLEAALDASKSDQNATLLGELLLGLTLDPAPVLAAYRRRKPKYEAPSVYILDYTLIRVFPDGSALEYTHNVISIDSESAVQSESEVSLPEGALPLALRTFKADGRVLDGEPIAEKQSISLPLVAVGDAIELAYVRRLPADPTYRGGYLSPRFYFQAAEVPFDRSEFVLVFPEGAPVSVDARGAAPQAETSKVNHTAGPLQVLRFRADKQQPHKTEPLAPPFTLWAPSVRVGTAASWLDFERTFAHVLLGRSVADPRDQGWARATFGQASDPVAAVFAYVLEHIEENGDLAGQAAAMLADGRGNRARVLAYLLRLLGEQPELLLAQTVAFDGQALGLPDEGRFTVPVVRVANPGGEARWLDPSSRYVAAGYLSPLIRGQHALGLSTADREATRELALATLPDGHADADRLEMNLDIELTAGGGARMTLNEVRYGAAGAPWREALQQMPPHAWARQVESSYVAGFFPGAEVKAVEAEHLEDAEQPLKLRFVIHVERFLAGGSQGRARLPSLNPAQLEKRLAREQQRQEPLLLPAPVVRSLRARIDLGPYALAGTLPSPVEVSEDALIAFDQQWHKPKAGQLSLEEHLRLKPTLIAPEAYPAFASACRNIDSAQQRNIDLVPAKRASNSSPPKISSRGVEPATATTGPTGPPGGGP